MRGGLRRWAATTAGCAVVALLAVPVQGGGARVVDGNGVPMTWNNAAAIVYRPDQGPLGQLDNATANSLLSGAFQAWASSANLSLSFSAGSQLPYDVDANRPASGNPSHWLNFWRKVGDGISPVIYDADGSIVDDMLGVGARFDVLGLGSVDTPLASSCTITEGSILINGAFFDGLSLPGDPLDPTSPVDLTSQVALQAVMVHEIGHLLNLDHSLVNHEMGNDGDFANDRYLPSMYPFQSEDDETAFTLSPDDEAAASALYPSPSLPSTTATISGRVYDPNGVAFQGAHVVARRTKSGSRFAYGSFSGGLYFPLNPQSCTPPPPPVPDAGFFLIKGLPPGSYQVCAEQADRRVSYANGTFAGPLATPATLPGPEDCWDPLELTDDPDDAGVITLGATGQSSPPIHLNALPSSDAFEPNDSLPTAQPLADLTLGEPVDTIAARIEVDDPDYYSFDVQVGDIVHIDLDAAELGSPLDPLIAVYRGTGDCIVCGVDDTFDPDSGIFTYDPAVTFIADSAGSYKVFVTAYPDFDIDGIGQGSSGPYFLRVRIDRDADSDGTVDRLDVCPNDPDEDADADGRCADVDNCDVIYNPGQADSDGDGIGDAALCDNCPSIYNPGQENSDLGDWIGDACDVCPFSAPDDADADGLCGDVDLCPSVYNPFQNGGTPERLNGPLPTGGSLVEESFGSSPDGSRVVYLADQDTLGVVEIYSVPSGGGASVKLNPPLVAGGAVLGFQISPDGSRVVYVAYQNIVGVDEIYSVPIAGGTAVKLNGTLGAGRRVTSYRISSSGRVVYLADQDTDEIYELYSVPIAGGAAVKISGSLVAGGDVGTLSLTPDGSWVVYSADQDLDGRNELYSVPAAGGTVTKLNPALVAGGNVFQVNIAAPAAPALPRAVYLADGDVNDRLELYSVAVDGSQFVKLNPAPVAGGNIGFALISPDASRVVYRADLVADEVFELYSVGLDGTGHVRIVPLSSTLDVTQFRIAADGSRVVYISDGPDEVYRLRSVLIAGTSSLTIGSELQPGGDVVDFLLTSDGARAVFRADREVDGMFELYSVRVDGSESVWKLNQPFPPAGDIGVFSVSPDGLTVGFTADVATDEMPDLFAVPVTSGTIRQINQPSVPGGFVSSLVISPDNQRAFYQIYQDALAAFELYGAYLPRDLDTDLILDSCDICPSTYNNSQIDMDVDGVGDACDNCPLAANPGQEDLEAAAGSDGTCGTQDDNSMLFGPDLTCDTEDDLVGDGHGDVCAPFTDIAGPVLALNGEGTFGAAWGDYDLDGDDDLYVVNEGTSNRLFRNEGGVVFTDVTTGPLGVVAQGRSASWGDYDNDGDPDLYVVNYLSANRLLRNDGAGLFTDVTTGPLGDPGPGVSAPWVDHDRDGDLDLYLVNHWAQNKLLRNDGGTFVEATPAPLALTQGGQSCAWSDYDDDGDPDLYLVNFGSANRLFRNDGSGAFTDVTAGPLGDTGLGTGAAWGDYDHDGDPDLYLTNSAGTNRLLHNNGTPSFTFTDVTAVEPALGATSGSYSPSWIDFDNDGNLDLYVTNFSGANRLHLNDGVFPYFQVATIGPLQDAGQGLGAAWADIDLDGDPDLYLANHGGRNLLVRNDATGANHWIQVDLRGTPSNRSAIGAKVTVIPDVGFSQVREVTGGSGFASQHSHTLMFGLGATSSDVHIEIDWPSGQYQLLSDVPVDQRIIVTEEDTDPPDVILVFPPNNAVDVPLSSTVLLVFDEPINPASVTTDTVWLNIDVPAGLKVPARLLISADRRIVAIEPTSQLSPGTDYVVVVTDGVNDGAGNSAGFGSLFDTTSGTSAENLSAEEVGVTASGAKLGGEISGEQFGFAAAVVGDVNGDGFDDIVVGAPKADPSSVTDAGRVDLIFGASNLMDGSTNPLFLSFTGEAALHNAGAAVAAAGDVNGDGRADFLIGAPHGDPNGTDPGKAYLVFGSSGLDELAPGTFGLGSLGSCAWLAPPCGIAFPGAAAGDRAGAAISGAGNINGDVVGDVYPDILIGAPRADPGGRADAGKTYLLYGPFAAPGTIPLSSVESLSAPGLVFHGESAGDLAGAAVSDWKHFGPGQVDDLLIGAPGATVLDDGGAQIPAAGLVYAVHGGTANLDDSATPGVIELSRVANGLADEVAGVVFNGTDPNQAIGRSVVGSVDVDGDGQPDLIIGAEGEVWIISGDGPKGATTSSNLEKTSPPGPSTLNRPYAAHSAVSEFSAAFFSGGADGDLGGAAVARAGDVNNDGYDDVIIGAPGVDAGVEADAGKAYVVYGSPIMASGEHTLAEIGTTSSGAVITGAAGSDLLGTSVGGGGDLNGDGIDDVLVGAPAGDTLPATPPDSGEAYLFSLLPPAEVDPVIVTHAGSAVMLEWEPTPLALAYNVYRGNLGQIPIVAGGVKTSLMTGLACGIATDSDMDGLPDYVDADPLLLGAGHYYLVTARNQAGEGPLASVLQSPARINDAQCP